MTNGKQERKKERSLNLATKDTGQRLFTIKTRGRSVPLFLFLFLTSNHHVSKLVYGTGMSLQEHTGPTNY